MGALFEDWRILEHYLDGVIICNMPHDIGRSDILNFDLTKCSDVEEVISIYKEAEKEHLPEIESAISLICLSGEVDLKGFSTEALYLLRNRAETAALFIFHTYCGDKTLFPKSQCTLGQAIQWLLVEWWNHHGREASAYNIIASDWSERNTG